MIIMLLWIGWQYKPENHIILLSKKHIMVVNELGKHIIVVYSAQDDLLAKAN